MKLNEIGWEHRGVSFKWGRLADGRVELRAGDQRLILADEEAAEQLTQTWRLLRQPGADVPVGRKTALANRAPPDPDFPKKVRNGVLIMVALVVIILLLDAFRLF